MQMKRQLRLKQEASLAASAIDQAAKE